jgi:hypothetical protein
MLPVLRLYDINDRIITEFAALVEWELAGKTKILWEKLVQVSFCVKQLPHDQNWNQTQATSSKQSSNHLSYGKANCCSIMVTNNI